MSLPPVEDSRATGVVLSGTGGLFRVAVEDGELVCRARGRLRAREAEWRDARDADRTDAALRPGEEDPATQDEDVGDVPVRESPPAAGMGHRASGRRGAGRGDRRDGAPPTRPRGPAASPLALQASGDGEEADLGALLPGDRVRCTNLGGGEGVIDEVLPRRTLLTRPPIANPDQVVVVAAWGMPPFSAAFVDRVLVEAARQGCQGALCLNKCDLLGEAERAEAELALAPFAAAGYPVLLTSAVRGDGLERLRAVLAGRLAVLSGPSGSGKSRLLAALVPGSAPRSGDLSRRAGRGRHTTRAVQLLALGGPTGGWVADTPGFSRLRLEDVTLEDLPLFYPEFAPHASACRFRGCLHDAEPECAVRTAVEAHRIDAGRYERYLALVTEVRARRPRW